MALVVEKRKSYETHPKKFIAYIIPMLVRQRPRVYLAETQNSHSNASSHSKMMRISASIPIHFGYGAESPLRYRTSYTRSHPPPSPPHSLHRSGTSFVRSAGPMCRKSFKIIVFRRSTFTFTYKTHTKEHGRSTSVFTVVLRVCHSLHSPYILMQNYRLAFFKKRTRSCRYNVTQRKTTKTPVTNWSYQICFPTKLQPKTQFIRLFFACAGQTERK